MNKKDDNRTIPVIVGITGHRDIRREDEDKLRKAVREELKKLQAVCPHSRLVVLTSLARGADMLCAGVAEEMGFPLYIVLPMEKETFANAQQFTDLEQREFNNFCEKAERLFVTSITEEAPDTEVAAVEKELPDPRSNRAIQSLDKEVLKRIYDHLYRQAGIYIISHCHVLLALWDGVKSEKAGGCGTADIIKSSLKGAYYPISGVSFRSASNEAVIHIFTPRGVHAEKEAGTVSREGNWTAVEEVIQKTDKFNALSSQINIDESNFYLLPKDYKEKNDPVLEHINSIYHISDTLSTMAQTEYRKALKWMAVLGTIITFSFLLYDEAEMTWLILACGLALLAAYYYQRKASKSDCHENHLEYRVLAEDLRVQANLRYAGSQLQVANLLPWTQQEETAWIMDALCALTAGDRPEEGGDIEAVKESIKKYWLDDQLAYHKKKILSQEKDNAGHERIIKGALRFSILLYVITLLFEIICGGLLIQPVISVSDIEVWRSGFKVFLGTASVAALFAANYYGKLSPQRILSDHRKMANFYERMSMLLENNPDLPEEVLTTLAREMLIENGNWYSYQKDNTPDINI